MEVTPRQAKVIVKYSIETKRSLLLVGPPGIGKSEIVEQVSAEVGARMLYFHTVTNEPTDFRGLGIVVKEPNLCAEWVPFGMVKELCDAQSLTIAFLDDLGQAAESVQASLMQLLQARRVGEHKISDDVVFIAATNRRRDRAGVHGILSAILTRFRTVINLVPSVEDWCSWALGQGLPATGIAFIRMRPTFLSDCAKDDFVPPREIKNYPSPRTITEALRHELECERLGLDDNILLLLLAGAAGDAFAIEYMAFRKLAKSLPDPVAILLNPSTAQIPDMNTPEGPSLAYAIAIALGRIVNENTIASALSYLKRINSAEYEAVLMKTAIQNKPEVANSPTFLQWASDNADLII